MIPDLCKGMQILYIVDVTALSTLSINAQYFTEYRYQKRRLRGERAVLSKIGGLEWELPGHQQALQPALQLSGPIVGVRILKTRKEVIRKSRQT